jgi:hypothetical protein
VVVISDSTTSRLQRIGLLTLKALPEAFCEYNKARRNGSLTWDRSQKAPYHLGTDAREVRQYCGVIRNFLNYILTHSVCPEYMQEILAARKVCDTAEKELALIKEVGVLMPGDFNVAASTLFGGYYQDLGPPAYTELSVEERQMENLTGMTIAEADRVFKTAIAFTGTKQQFNSMMGATQPFVVGKECRTLEVCEIVLPDAEVKAKLSGLMVAGELCSTKPLGILRVKHWDNPEADEEDMSDDGQENNHATNPADSVIDSFWVEENVLEKCFVGMKFGATVHELNIGVKYFDEITGIYCSFFDYLNTERLSKWKDPVLNTRPPPTIDDLRGQQEDDFDNDADD